MSKVKLAIIGANYLQKPLVEKARSMEIETHLFAWQQGNVAAGIAENYYPISITEKETILEKCLEIGIDGIVSVGSDLAMLTVNFVADKMKLVGNSLESTFLSTNKFSMRTCFSQAGIECPKFAAYCKPNYNSSDDIQLPLIVKPVDRSGSIGVKKVERAGEVNPAIEEALAKSYKGSAIVEEFIRGKEYSIEMISHKGRHHFLAITEKVTTGSPYFVEIAHHQPAMISDDILQRIIGQVIRGLDALGLENGATHSEIMLVDDKDIFIIEIAGRMGGCFIGSHMVSYSTGYDYLKGVIDIALDRFNEDEVIIQNKKFSGVYYVVPSPGRIAGIKDFTGSYKNIVASEVLLHKGDLITSTTSGPSNRAAIFVYAGDEKLKFNPGEVIQFKMEPLNKH